MLGDYSTEVEMGNGVHANPENDTDWESGEKVGCLYSDEMTQDVIEWDESKNKDLGKLFRSPQPPGSGSKGPQRQAGTRGSTSTAKIKSNNGSQSNTPSSTSTNNSSIFAGTKRQFDPRCHFDTITKKRSETKNKNALERGIGNVSSAPNNFVDAFCTVDNTQVDSGFPATSSLPNPLGQKPKRGDDEGPTKNELRSHRIQTNVNQRHRRRRLGYSHKHQNEPNTNISSSTASASATAGIVLQRQCPTTTTVNALKPTLETKMESKKSTVARHDDFADLLQAITTPKASCGSGKLSRVPLSPVDQNNRSISQVTEKRAKRIGVDCSSSENNTRKKLENPLPGTSRVNMTEKIPSFPQPNFDEITTNTTNEKDQLHQRLPPGEANCCSLDRNHNGKNQKPEEDEFGETSFSEDDLAKIDSLTQPTSLHGMKKQCDHPVVEIPAYNGKGTLATTTNADKNDLKNKKTDETSHSTCVKEAADEFGDFPSDIDFAEIDAMVPTQSLTPNEEQSARPSKSEHQPRGDRSPGIRDHKEGVKREDEDEFGYFLNDVDFSHMDALVATQCLPSKCTDVNISKQPSEIASHPNESRDIISSSAEKLPKLKSDDEFGDFPDDIDFNVLDEVVAERMVSQKRASVDPGDAVRNLRTNRRNFAEPSFMTFSRYKVLTVDIDQRNNTKTLGVATWIDSMLESDEMMKTILRDGRVGKSGCHVSGEEDSWIFTDAKHVDYPEDGLLYLCGEWSFTPVRPGDVIHVCSLTGQYRTDAQALPIVLHSYPPPGSDIDDLILVLHPDMLMSPSIISEASSCNRRAALKCKMGSTGISSKSAFIGTIRHGLFEACMKTGEFDSLFARGVIKKMIREKAEMLIGCNVSEYEAEAEVLSVLPLIQQFAKEYTTLRKDIMMLSSLGRPVGGAACHPDIRLLVKGVHSVEENIVSHSLGLKGSVDAVLESESTTICHKHSHPSSNSAFTNPNDLSPQQSLMCLELKTGHNQNVQNVHMAQLSLYTVMLHSRYGVKVEFNGNSNTESQPPRKSSEEGGAPGGILLYLNDKSQRICHVSPQMNELKTLMSLRNVVASDSKEASRPRGISLSFDEASRTENKEYLTAKLLPAPTANLPEVKATSHSCKRCYSNRECMLYAASNPKDDLESHRNLLLQFTGHLEKEDLEYFRKWDRLIDIEAESSNSRATSTQGLLNPSIRQKEIGESISEIIFDAESSVEVGTRHALVCFRQKTEVNIATLGIAKGSHVIVSTDGTLLDNPTKSPRTQTQTQPQNRMYAMEGYIDSIEEDGIFISMTSDEMNQIRQLSGCHEDNAQENSKSYRLLLFRLHKSTKSVGTGTLRWNLVNFLTSDYTARTEAEFRELDLIKQRRLTWLRDVVIRLKVPEFAQNPPSPLFHGIDLNIPGCNLPELAKEFHLLNDAQQMAVKKVMSGRDYTLIQGLPGTGKTSTLEFLARLLVARGRRVLITAYTHSAVDNIMSKLLEKGMGSRDSKSKLPALIRVGNNRPGNQKLRPIIHSEVALKLDKTSKNQINDVETANGDSNHPSAASLKEVIAASRILGVSALSLPRSSLLQSEVFDVVIIDEAGQMNEPTALGALAAADSFVLVGDHKQLPPLVNSSVAERGGYGVSILKRLADRHPHAVAPLTMQYRMNEAICKISSESIYGGQLQCGNEKVRSRLLNLPGFPSSLPTPSGEQYVAWLHPVIDPERSVVFVDTDKMIKRIPSQPYKNKEGFVALEEKFGGSIVNRTEAKLVHYILEAMELCGHDLSEIGVISPFRAQVKVIDNAAVAHWKRQGLELSTIDKYQGRDKSTIILSLVRSNDKGNAGRLLQDERRLNVAFTRAKCKLIVIGSYRTLSNGSIPLKPILNRMDMRNQRYDLPGNAFDCYKMK